MDSRINTRVDSLVSDYSDINFYLDARNTFLSRTFTEYPHLEIFSFDLSFSISGTAKNGVLIYAMLNSLPEELYIIDKNYIEIFIKSENELVSRLELIANMLIVVQGWTSTKLLINGIQIGTTTSYKYIEDYLLEKHSRPDVVRLSIIDLKKKYIAGKAKKRKTESITNQSLISRNHVEEALGTVFQKYIELYATNKQVVTFEIDKHEKVLVLEDSLVVDFRVLPGYWTCALNDLNKAWEFPFVNIQELTHNDLFRFNLTAFRKHFKMEHIGVDFFAYHGVHYYRKEIDNYDAVNQKLPELRLQDRNNNYPGEIHHFVILRIENVDGKVVYGIGDTKGKIHSFVLKLCKELEEKNSRSLVNNGASCLPYAENKDFIEAFLSWEGKKKRWRLENKFAYFYEDIAVKNDLDLFEIPKKIVQRANAGSYDHQEFGSYSKPLNRWKSEELVYNIVKSLYKDFQVVYQYKPYYLSTENGCMSYDIYICGLKIAIEYQGKQHFEPVDYFGGMESFQEQKKRDSLKAERSAKNGVKLVYINYWEDITPSLVKKRITEALNSP